MNRARKISLACALAGAAFFCGTAYAAKPLTVAEIDMVLNDLPLVYAQKEGFFSAEGLAVEKMKVARGVTSLLVSGQADLAIVSLGPVLAAYQSGADLKVLAFLYPRFDVYGVSRFNPEEGARIKSVAINSGGATPKLIMDPFLDHLKVDRKSLKTVIAVSDAAQYAMLEMGYADLINVGAPELLAKIRAENKYYLVPLADTGKTGDPIGLVASGKAFRKRGPELRKFTAVLYSTLRAAAADREKTIKLLTEEFRFSPGDAATYYENFAAVIRNGEYPPSTAMVEAVSSRIDLPEFKVTKDYKDLVYPDYAWKAMEPYRVLPPGK